MRVGRLRTAALLVGVATALAAAAPAQAAVGLDRLVSANGASSAPTIASPAFTTSAPNELLVAFLASDGPKAAGSQTFSSVTGAGVTWRLARRANTQFGTAEIWTAAAPTVVTNATVTATRGNGSFQGHITVATFTGADAASGVTAAASAATGAPTASLTTTRAGSWVWGVGDDWDKAIARTVGLGQTKVAEFLAPAGDTFWVQRQDTTTAAAGTSVTINDSQPTTDRWNLALIEIAPATASGPDTQAPTAPSGLKADSVTGSKVDLSWTPSSDNVGVTGYRVFRGSTLVGDVPGTTFSDTGVSPGTAYSYTVRAYDSATNVSDPSNTLNVTTPAPDSSPPTVQLTAPADGASVSGSTTVTANAGDDVGVAGVQFLLDGAALGAEDTSAPYSISWDTTTVANGQHALSARARDAAGNTTAAATVAVTVSNGTDPAQVGQWGPLSTLPAVAVHSALLPTGKVLLWQGDFAHGGMQYVFDPDSGTTVQVPDAVADLFCAGQAVLADGRVLVVGGTKTSGGLGVPDITAFNWQNSTWTALAPMQYPRWYATGTTLSDGKVLVTSGANTRSTDLVPIPELYSPATNTWQQLTAASRTIPYYSFIYQLPDGRVARMGASEQATPTEVLDLGTNQWSTIDSRTIDGGSITNYAPGRFMKAGSASDSGFSGQSLRTAYTLDMNQAGASWQPTGDMNFQRSFLNLTNLPDGKVLATGGGTDKSGEIDANSVLPAEMWDPGSGNWTKLASMAVGRLYHSVALLLPDARVYVAGGGGDPGVPDQRNAQIYSPPYLFKGARPTISSAPSTVRYGDSITVGTPDATSIRRVSLIRSGSVTHAFDQNTRSLSLAFTQTAGGLQVQLPANGNLAPPGYYMLFIVDDKGVPSVASWVRFPAPYEDDQAPSAPSGLVADPRLDGADLRWTAADDNVGVTAYNVHRSTSTGFTPSAANKVGQTASTTFTDSGVAAGTYYYKVTAQDAAGNVGPPSSEAKVVVAGDTSPPTVPTGLSGSTTSDTASLTWTASDDNVGVARYRISRGGTEVGTSTTTSFTDVGLSPATAYDYTVVAQDAAGNRSDPSAPLTLTTATAPALTLDRTVTTRQGTRATTITSPSLTTARPGELLVAFLASDGPNTPNAQSFTSITGGGLTWTLRRRANTQAGTAEIWQAVAPTALSGVQFTAQRGNGTYQGAMTVAAFIGADTSALGAAGNASALTGAPSVSLTSTRAGSWVWGVGDDWDRATPRTLGAGQTMVDEFLAPAGDTFWTQRRSSLSPTSGATMTLDATAPTTDRWNLAAVEVLPAQQSGAAGLGTLALRGL